MSMLFWTLSAYGATGVLVCCQNQLKKIDTGLLIAVIGIAAFSAHRAVS